MHMQAKGTTDYKSGFTFAFEQLLNVRANKPFRGRQCRGGLFAAEELCVPPESLHYMLKLCNYSSSMLLYILSGLLSKTINKTELTVIKQS